MEKRSRLKCTPRSSKVQPFYVMELLERAQVLEREGEDVVHMEIGEPDFATPPSIRDAAIKAIREGRTFYTHSLGLPSLRERIARFYLEIRGVKVSPERIIVTNGTSGAFFLLAAVLLDRKRSLLISDPGYPCYRNFGILMAAPIVSIAVAKDSGFEVSPEQLEEVRAQNVFLIICSPSNPTGIVYGKRSLEGLYQAITERRGTMAVDEIYSGLTYGIDFPSALSVTDGGAIVIDGFSKTYAMTGWRLGWTVVPEDLVRPMQKIAQNVFISAPTVAQHAAMAAFDALDEIDAMRRIYEERRNFLFPRLQDIGFGLPIWPDGAFYIYANIEKWGMDSMEFVGRALAEAKVAIAPGYDFGSYGAGSYVRFSYASSTERLEEGCKRLEEWTNCL
jgi:aspartate/methionine/tyrosine aminotransferase